MKSIKKWLHSVRERNKRPIDTPYTFVYTLTNLALPQPWRQTSPEALLLPTELVLKFTDPGRLSLLRVSEPQQLEELKTSMLKDGLRTPLELYMDVNGKVRLQEGHHRMCVAIEHLHEFPKVPVLFRETNGRIKSYGRPVVEEFSSILEIIGKQ